MLALHRCVSFPKKRVNDTCSEEISKFHTFIGSVSSLLLTIPEILFPPVKAGEVALRTVQVYADRDVL